MTTFNQKSVPQSLKDRNQWVLWKHVTRDGNQTKVPYTPQGKPAKTNDPTTWNSFSDCLRAVERFDGVGFVFTKDDPYVGIDLDGCRDPQTGKIASWAQKIINLTDSYVEVSPSGTGVKIFVQGSWPHGGQKTTLESEPSISSKAPGIEVYAEKRYFVVTGERIPGRHQEVEERQEPLNSIYDNYFSKRNQQNAQPLTSTQHGERWVIQRASAYVAKIPPAVSGRRGHDATFHVACILVIGFGLSEADAMPILQKYNKRCAPPWSTPELQHKLSDAAQQPGPRNTLRFASENLESNLTIAPEEHSAIDLASGQFSEMQALTDELIRNLRNKGEAPVVRTGVAPLDKTLRGGLRYGTFVALAGLSGHLKSGFAQQIGHHITGHEKVPFAFVSLEMSKEYVAERTVQYASAAPRSNWAKLTERLKKDTKRHYQGAAPYLVVEGSPELAEVVQIVTRLFKSGVRIVAVDYLQLIETNSMDAPHLALRKVVDRLSQLAKQNRAIILGLAQLRKGVEKERRPYIPQLSDLEYGPRLGQSADICLVGFWPHKIDSKKPEHEYKLFVVKNRNGESQVVINCRIDPDRMRVS